MNTSDRTLRIFAPILGRILMGAFFLWNGIQATFNLSMAASGFQVAGVTLPLLLTVVLICVEVIGGMFLIVGFKTRAVALVQVVFLLLTSILFIGFSSDTQIAMFMQNMAIIGGLLYLAAS